jgi:hypothetical protein
VNNSIYEYKGLNLSQSKEVRDRGHSENKEKHIMSKTPPKTCGSGRVIKPVLFWTLSTLLGVGSGGPVISILA